MAEDNHIKEEVQQALSTGTDQIQLETIQDEHTSPLNSPVIEKDIGGESLAEARSTGDNWNIWKPEKEETVSELDDQVDYRKQVEDQIEREKQNEPLDAPTQEINEEYLGSEQEEQANDTAFEIPLSQANQTADALLGITNNVLRAGGSFFVKVKKHEEFYEFGEIVEVIDTQNEKNVERILLDSEDKELLRPLLSQVIRKKAKQLTPEQQLMGAVASIMIKKGQTIMEIRSENKNLENRLLTIIKEQKQASEQNKASNDYQEDFNAPEASEIVQEVSEQELDKDDNKHKIVTESKVAENSIMEYAEPTEDK
ncbi:hypothetical protein U8527_10425 [Kordia algicida OT-1]|uniref:Uncharacterized protein n=1 Tax=Kordia algicida OT-1 TaxID=391587 RepID=A9DW77_9FLAO|nr:hypothetical protein [Kordia algicida]EDP96521.1 hypothetical protein KAOT1_03892 [Kordia algicida OT-1]